ncbi:MAG: hypothetical protein AAGC60_15115 [Acidobacteriota bacterium]
MHRTRPPRTPHDPSRARRLCVQRARPLVLTVVLGTFLLSSTACTARIAPARTAVVHRGDTTVVVRTAPPPPRREVVVVRPTSRHVWVAGHWTWRRGNWSWVRGTWTVPPRGKAVWVAPRTERRGGGWVLVRGHWR